MKKFITTIPLQITGELDSCIYEAADNSKLQYNKKIAFPILAVMNAYVKEGEQIFIYKIRQDDSRTIENNILFEQQVKEFEKERNCQCVIEEILIKNDELISTHLETFEKLIEKFDQEETKLYACITYGTKPVPIIEMIAINYACRALGKTTLECVVYGWYRFKTKEAKVFDITSLFYLDEIVRNAADMNVADPLVFMKDVLTLQETGDEE